MKKYRPQRDVEIYHGHDGQFKDNPYLMEGKRVLAIFKDATEQERNEVVYALKWADQRHHQITKLVRLEGIVETLLETDSTTDAIKTILEPFTEESNDWEQHEEHLFNESRLYEALGKDDARTILSVWGRLRQICEILKR